jgi:hypothetical protein
MATAVTPTPREQLRDIQDTYGKNIDACSLGCPHMGLSAARMTKDLNTFACC